MSVGLPAMTMAMEAPVVHSAFHTAPTIMHAAPTTVMAAPIYAAPTTTYAAAPTTTYAAAPTTTYAAAPTTTYAAPATVMAAPAIHGGSMSYVAPISAPTVSHVSAAPAVSYAAPPTVVHAAAPTMSYAAAPTVTAAPAVSYAAPPTTVMQAHSGYHIPQTYVKPGKLHPIDAARYKALQQAIPWQRERLPERQQMFARMDALNHNGILSFSEVEAGLNSLIGLETVVPDSKMVLMKCFNEAKDWCQSHTGTGCPYADYVEKKEFRMMLELLHKELDARSGPDTGHHE